MSLTCPHCSGFSTFDAQGEAPNWAKRWMKCFSCGERWDAGAPYRRRPTIEAPVKLALPDPFEMMRPTLPSAEVLPTEETEEEEDDMGKWSQEARERLAQSMQESHARRGHKRSEPKEMSTTTQQPPKQKPAEPSGHPLLVETSLPTNGGHVEKWEQVIELNGTRVGVTMIDDLVERTRQDLAALERVQAILGRPT